MNFTNDFKKFALSEGISSLSMHYQENMVESLYPTASVTPMIIEERQLHGVSLSVFDRLMMDRIIWYAGVVNERSSTITQAQLMYLDSVETSDITMQINSPGGGVYAGLSIVDVMDYIKSDIATINVGMAASMGSVLLGAGTKGKRSSLRFSRTMLHQSSGGAGGNIQDARIAMAEWNRLNTTLFELLGSYCGKDPKQVEEDASRDLWLTSDLALDYGIIDEVIKKQ